MPEPHPPSWAPSDKGAGTYDSKAPGPKDVATKATAEAAANGVAGKWLNASRNLLHFLSGSGKSLQQGCYEPLPVLWEDSMFGRWARGIGGSLLVILIVSGCSLFGSGADGTSGSDHASGSGGYATASSARVTVEYPEGWQRVPVPKDDEKTTLLIEKIDDGDPVAEVAIADELIHAQRVKSAARQILNTQRIGTTELKRKDAHHIEVHGAQDARRVDYVFSGTTAGGEKTGDRVRATDVSVMGARNWVTLVRVSGVRSVLDDEVVEHIVGSIEFSAGS